MSIEGINSTQLVQKLRSIDGTDAQSTDSVRSGQGSDEVSISEDARLAQTLNRAEQAIDEAPDVREGLVEDVQRRLDQGHYDSPEVIDQVAQEMTNTFLGG